MAVLVRVAREGEGGAEVWAIFSATQFLTRVCATLRPALAPTVKILILYLQSLTFNRKNPPLPLDFALSRLASGDSWMRAHVRCLVFVPSILSITLS